MKYKIVLFYARSHQQEFNSKEEAMRAIRARALTRATPCYTELWEMKNEDAGEHVATFDYGSTEPIELVQK